MLIEIFLNSHSLSNTKISKYTYIYAISPRALVKVGAWAAGGDAAQDGRGRHGDRVPQHGLRR